MTRYLAAADIGGTFTDVVVIDAESGESRIAKVLSTPPDLSIGVVAGLEQLLPTFDRVEFFAHGTTAGINALLERRGVRCALVTTSGFRDVYEMGRGDRPEMYNLRYHRAPRLVSRLDVYELPQRTLADGSVSASADERAIEALAEQLDRGEYQAIAICFLHAYANPSEEARVAAVLRDRLPGVTISPSYEVANEWREYERSSTAVMNAYIAPIVERYVEQLEQTMQRRGLQSSVHIMQSNGGVMTARAARQLPLATLLSGPVGGAIGGRAIGQQIGVSNILTTDMGGTSFDVSLVVDGALEVATETEIEGFPLLMPVVNIHTIGAGGGSIAWIEAGGLRVGPQSAGAEPGPACYGRGGTQPTVTDANAILGRLSPDRFLGGAMRLDLDAAELAHQALARQLGMSVIELAEGILDVVNAKMANAIRTLTVARGIDPRTFTLVAFGGAGPLHAAFLAEELEIPAFVVPASAGIFSAWGMLQTDIRHDFVRSFYRPADAVSLENIQQVSDELRQRATDVLHEEGLTRDRMRFRLLADMRYIGQEYFVTLEISPPGGFIPSIADISEAFHSAYERRYGHAIREAAVEFVNLRMAATGRLRSSLPPSAQSDVDAGEALPDAYREIRFGHRWERSGVYERSRLLAGNSVKGPAIIDEQSATTIIPPGFRAEVDRFGNLLVRASVSA